MKKYFLFSLLLLFFSYKGSADDMLNSFESCDMPGWYIGVKGEDVTLLRLDNEINRENTTFNIVPGLVDDNGKYLSIQAATDRNYYLCVQNGVLKLHEYSSWMFFKETATFSRATGQEFRDLGFINLSEKVILL